MILMMLLEIVDHGDDANDGDHVAVMMPIMIITIVS